MSSLGTANGYLLHGATGYMAHTCESDVEPGVPCGFTTNTPKRITVSTNGFTSTGQPAPSPCQRGQPSDFSIVATQTAACTWLVQQTNTVVVGGLGRCSVPCDGVYSVTYQAVQQAQINLTSFGIQVSLLNRILHEVYDGPNTPCPACQLVCTVSAQTNGFALYPGMWPDASNPIIFNINDALGNPFSVTLTAGP